MSSFIHVRTSTSCVRARVQFPAPHGNPFDANFGIKVRLFDPKGNIKLVTFLQDIAIMQNPGATPAIFAMNLFLKKATPVGWSHHFIVKVSDPASAQLSSFPAGSASFQVNSSENFVSDGEEWQIVPGELEVEGDDFPPFMDILKGIN